MGVAVGVQVFHAVRGEHSGAVSAAHLADVVPQIFVAHHAGQRLAVAAALHGPYLYIVVHTAVNDKRFVHRRCQRLHIGLCRSAALGSKAAVRQQSAQLCKGILAAVQADRQLRVLQHLCAQGIQLFTQCCPIAALLHAAQELVIAHTAAAFTHRTVHRVVGTGAGGCVYIALLDELLFHVQLLLAQHPCKSSFCRRAGKDGIIQPFAAQLHSLFQTAFQQAQAQAQLGMAGCTLLPPSPDVQLGAAVAQPCAAQSVQLLSGVFGAVQLVQHIGQQVQIRHVLRLHITEVIVEVQVQAACRRVMHQLRTGQKFPLAWGRPCSVAKVGNGQRVLQHKLAVGADGFALLFFRQGGHLHHLHRSRCKQLTQQLIEPAIGHLFPQGSKQPVRVQQQGGVAGVQPAGRSVDGIQHAVWQGARALQRCKLCCVQRSQQQFLRDALGQNAVHRLAHSGSKLAGALLGGTAQHQFQHRLQGAVVKANVNICAQLFGQQRRLQRGVIGAKQGIQQDLHAQLTLPVCKGTGVPCQSTLHLVRLRVFGIVGQFHAGTRLLVLHGQLRTAGALGHFGEIIPVQQFQLFSHIHFAIEGNAAVVGAVVAVIYPLILFIGQRRDAGRVAAGNKAVGRIREHGPFQCIFQLSIRCSQSALHLVVHHSAHGAVGTAVPALLLKHALVHHSQRAEHRVQVDIHQVFEVGLIGRSERVDRLIREGHRIQERCHAAFEQLQERRGHRVFFAACQHRVLQNVEHASVIGREGAKADAKRLVGILIFHQQHRGTAHIVGKHGQGSVLFRAVLGTHEGITGKSFHFVFSFVVLKSFDTIVSFAA